MRHQVCMPMHALKHTPNHTRASSHLIQISVECKCENHWNKWKSSTEMCNEWLIAVSDLLEMIQSRQKKDLHTRTRAEKRVSPSPFWWWTTGEMMKNGIVGAVHVWFIFLVLLLLLLRFEHTEQAFADTQNMTNVFDVQQCIIEMSTCNRCVARRTFSEYEITINPSLTTCSRNRLGKLKFNLHQMFLAQCKNCAAFPLDGMISWKKHPFPRNALKHF